MKTWIKKALIAVSAPLMMLAFVNTAQANTAANTTISNTASLTYTGLATPITAQVDLTVSLLASAPTVSAPTANTVALGSSSTMTFTITTTANGPEAYNLSSTAVTPTNVTGTSAPAAVTFNQGGPNITSVTLGATTVAATVAAGDTAFTVPSDGYADASVNGLVAGDTIVVDGYTYTIASIVDNATGTSTVNLTTPVSAAAATSLNTASGVLGGGIGVLIAEQQTFDTVLPTVGTAITTPGNPTSVDTTVQGASSSVPALTGSATATTNIVQVTFDKYVRNVTTPTTPNGSEVLLNGFNYYPTGNVTANSGETLEYAIVVTTPASGGVSGAAINDTLPAFTSYVANSTRLNAITVVGDGAALPITNLLVDDNLARVAGAAATGTIAAGKTVITTFQVTVN